MDFKSRLRSQEKAIEEEKGDLERLNYSEKVRRLYNRLIASGSHDPYNLIREALIRLYGYSEFREIQKEAFKKINLSLKN